MDRDLLMRMACGDTAAARAVGLELAGVEDRDAGYCCGGGLGAACGCDCHISQAGNINCIAAGECLCSCHPCPLCAERGEPCHECAAAKVEYERGI
jgi:hypothetical protein